MERPLVILRYNRDVSVTGDTLGEHNRVIGDWGAAWWGWFPTPADNVPAIANQIRDRLVGKSKFLVALWDRTHGELAVAMCRKVTLQRNEEPREAPDPARVPQDAEHPPGKWPAWFELLSVDRMEQDEFVQKFRITLEVEATSTVLWPNDMDAGGAGHPTLQPHRSTTDRDSLLHLSDLHFGERHRWGTNHNKREGLTTFQSLQSSMELNGVDPKSIGGIVISGDISSLGPHPVAYDESHGFICQLFEWIGIDQTALIIVPGNHDIARLPKDESLDGDAQSRAQHDRTRAGEVLYRQFMDRIYRIDRAPMVRWHQIDFLGGCVRINFLALNSARLTSIDDREYGYTGKAHQAYLRPILADKKQRDAQGLTTIGCAVLHHHLISAYTDKIPVRAVGGDWVDPVSCTLDSDRILRELSDSQFQLVLHGHQHVPSWSGISKTSGWVIDVDGGGSLGAHGDWLHPDYNYNYWSIYKVSPTQIIRSVFPLNDTPVARAAILVQSRELR